MNTFQLLTLYPHIICVPPFMLYSIKFSFAINLWSILTTWCNLCDLRQRVLHCDNSQTTLSLEKPTNTSIFTYSCIYKQGFVLPFYICIYDLEGGVDWILILWNYLDSIERNRLNLFDLNISKHVDSWENLKINSYRYWFENRLGFWVT